MIIIIINPIDITDASEFIPMVGWMGLGVLKEKKYKSEIGEQVNNQETYDWNGRCVGSIQRGGVSIENLS